MGCTASVAENEQLLITSHTGKTSVRNGPGIMCVGCVEEARKRPAVLLAQGQYTRVTDEEDGSHRIVAGPAVLFLGARERAGAPRDLPVLRPEEYCKLRDDRTGDVRVEYGPQVVELGAYETVVSTETSPVLQQSQYCIVRDERSGEVRSAFGPGMVKLGPYEAVFRDAEELPVLRKNEYVRVKNTESGSLRIEVGPAVVQLGPRDQVVGTGVQLLPVLNQGEYCLVKNTQDGQVQAFHGPLVVTLGVFDQVLGGIRSSPVLQKAEYCVVKDGKTGAMRAVFGPGLVELGAYEQLCRDVTELPVLRKGEYVKVKNTESGDMRIVLGPVVVELGPQDQVLGGIQELPVLRLGESCRVKNTQDGQMRAFHGPQVVTLGPFDELVGGVRPCPVLQKSEYCVVKDEKTGDLRAVYGPGLLRLEAHETLYREVTELPVLREGEYVKVKDTDSGDQRVEIGPAVVQLGPRDQVLGSGVGRLPVLRRGEYCLLKNIRDGGLQVFHGPCHVPVDVHDELVVDDRSADGVRKCPDLSGDEYLVVRNEAEGTMWNEVGPQVFKPGPFDVFGPAQKIINLGKTDYVRIRHPDGRVSVQTGEQRLVPEPLDVVESGVQQAVNVDEHNAVLIRNLDSGSLELVTRHGIFFPSAYQEIVKVQEKIILEPYETVVCRDTDGVFYYASGDPSAPAEERGPGPNFFLPPHHELVSQSWSTDLRKEHATATDVWKFDSRPSYMNYEFNCRTLDNVELVIDVYFFWRIIDVRSMVTSTADAPGDTCTHARSMIMQEVSAVKLMDFLENFNKMVRRAVLGDPFYAERGIELISAEVLKFECTNGDTNQILREIIQETCDRLKRTERQRGENEVAMARLDGEIAEERKRQELVEVKKSHLRVEARIEGEAEGTRIAAFLSKLAQYEGGGISMGKEKAFEIYEMQQQHQAMAAQNLEKRKAVEALGKGSAQLYVMPDDVNLHFGSAMNPMKMAGRQSLG